MHFTQATEILRKRPVPHPPTPSLRDTHTHMLYAAPSEAPHALRGSALLGRRRRAQKRMLLPTQLLQNHLMGRSAHSPAEVSKFFHLHLRHARVVQPRAVHAPST